MADYEIAFCGRLQPGADPGQVRANLSQLFKVDAARIEALFSGRRTVIKSALSQEMAEKYRVALERAGAEVEVVNLGASAQQDVPEVADNHVSTVPPAARDDYMAAFNHIDAPDFVMAPVGSLMQEDAPKPSAPVVDLSRLSLAPLGSDMGEIKRNLSQAVPDISHITLQ